MVDHHIAYHLLFYYLEHFTSALNVLQWHDLCLFRAYASATNSYITVKNVQASGCSTPYFGVTRIQRLFNQEDLRWRQCLHLYQANLRQCMSLYPICCYFV